MGQRVRPMHVEAADLRSRVRGLLARHAKGCPGCQSYLRTANIQTTCNTGWELGMALANLEHAEAALETELEAPDPRLVPLF